MSQTCNGPSPIHPMDSLGGAHYFLPRDLHVNYGFSWRCVGMGKEGVCGALTFFVSLSKEWDELIEGW